MRSQWREDNFRLKIEDCRLKNRESSCSFANLKSEIFNLRFLDLYTTATTSISTRTPRGSAATATVDRAGLWEPKAVA